MDVIYVNITGYNYSPRCRIGNGYVDVNEPCSLTCSNQTTSEIANMTCLNNNLHYRLCSNDTTHLNQVLNGSENTECKVCNWS